MSDLPHRHACGIVRLASQRLAWNAETQLSPRHYARCLNSPLAAGRGCTIRLPPFAKARRWTRTPRSSRPSSPLTRRAPTRSSRPSFRLPGRAATRSSQLAPALPLTPRTAPLWATSSSIWIYPPTCPARMLAGAFRCNAASPVPSPTTKATCRSTCQRDLRSTCSTTSPRTPPRTMSPKTTFRLLFKDSKWRRSPDTNRFAVEVGSSR